MQPSIQRLFNYSHVRANLSLWQRAVLAAYLPVGLALLVCRCILLVPVVVAFAVLPAGLFTAPMLRLMQVPFGLVVRVAGLDVLERARREHGSAFVLAANHTTAFDVFPFISLVRVRVLLDAGFYRLILSTFGKIVGAVPLDKSHGDKTTVRSAVLDALHSPAAAGPLLFFPEGWDTNSAVGLLQFNKFVFGLGKPIVPVALRARIPFGLALVPSMLGSSLAREVAYLLFYPCIVWQLDFLPTMQRAPGETEAAFARRVQQSVAAALGIAATSYSDKDALALRRAIMDSPHLRGELHAGSTHAHEE